MRDIRVGIASILIKRILLLKKNEHYFSQILLSSQYFFLQEKYFVGTLNVVELHWFAAFRTIRSVKSAF